MNNSAIEDITTVIFRRFPRKEGGAVIAIFPYEMADLEGNVQSYVHIGQHGGCSRWFTTFTKPANLEDADAQALKKELESEPYNYRFKVAKRVNHDRYMQEYWKMRKELSAVPEKVQ
jgi:hypothetical protein